MKYNDDHKQSENKASVGLSDRNLSLTKYDIFVLQATVQYAKINIQKEALRLILSDGENRVR